MPLPDDIGATLRAALAALAGPALVFTLLALALKQRGALAAWRRAWPQTRTNLGLWAVDTALVLPLLGILLAWLASAIAQGLLPALPLSTWESLPAWLVIVAALVVGDFTGYWRHRLEHSRWLWPAHAVHHADTQMTWLTVMRFHPLNRASTTLLDNLVLAMLGFPPLALAVNNIVRHWYGALVHADLPWTFGPLRFVLVSPAMHRWHHSRDVYGTNFATLFSVWDRLFGTLHDAGRCEVPLGVPGDDGLGVRAQLLWPLRTWAAQFAAWRHRARIP